jgi:4-hydroxy-tetrahydrodipicolinate synthase
MKTFKGSGVALVTPFQTDGSIDTQALKQLVQLQITGGTDFLVVQGTTGESPTLSQDEKRLVLDTVLEVNNGKLPVVYGIGGNFCQVSLGLAFLRWHHRLFIRLHF